MNTKDGYNNLDRKNNDVLDSVKSVITQKTVKEQLLSKHYGTQSVVLAQAAIHAYSAFSPRFLSDVTSFMLALANSMGLPITRDQTFELITYLRDNNCITIL